MLDCLPRVAGFCLAVSLLTVLCGPGLAADPTPDSRRLAAELPIADMHLHLFPELTPAELIARMDRNNVRWGGAVGPTNPRSDAGPFIATLGKRYVPMAAQPEFLVMFRESGLPGMSTVEHPRFKAMIERADADFQSKRIRGFGELILNNRASHPDPSFRRKAPIDSPPVRSMFEAAARNRGVVQIHMEPDRDSVAELETVMNAYATVPVILSHCFAVTSDTAMAEYFLRKYPRALCDLSARSEPLLPERFRSQMIFGANFADERWLKLMEAMPGQFVIGSDATSPQHDYDRIIGNYRSGLLPRLSPATARKIAFENAVRLFDLEE